jgi:hypothetical protein
MKLKSLLFGSAAVFAVGSGAQAADLPTVEPVEYVRICDAFGAGFYYIPGTDTCLKIAGYVRAESHWVGGDTGYTFGDPDNLYLVHEGHVNNWTTRIRGNVSFDARTETDIGLVRSYISMELTIGPGATSTTSSAPPVLVSDSDPTYSSTGLNLAAAYITITNDWGTYTAGKRGSFFDFWGGDTYGTRLGLQDGTADTMLFGWTFAGGNGFSFTVAAEDPASSGRYKGGGDDDFEGQESPDGVANIRVNQGWGSAQVMGAVRHVHDYSGIFPDETTADHDWSWAVGAGLSIGVPGGWTFNAQGGYTEGMLGYISGDPGGIGDIDFTGPAAPGILDAGNNTSWAARAGITGPLMNPNLIVWVNGNFIHAEEDSSGDEYDFWAVVAGAAYTLAPGLTVGPEFAYHSLDMTDVLAPDEVPDYDVFGVMWRIQRNF